MADDHKAQIQRPDINVEDLIIERDVGARAPRGLAGVILMLTALSWSFFQLWISSPLPFQLNFLIFSSSEARAIHLAFALFLAFTAYPCFVSSPRRFIPISDWLMAAAGAYCAAYGYIFYEELARRPGLPTTQDMVVAGVGIVLLLEAARRALGLPLLIVGLVFLGYSYFGSASWMPELIQHKGASLSKIASHQWLSTEGVFGIALGVSADFVFLFVLFGALLDKAGAGNYFIKVAFSLMGHLRGGPAKAAVLASGLTGVISGSSIANVVTTGTFTIPLMKRVGFTSEKAGAVEVAGSVNGQIMPPVMGAAAFLMVEYIGISYREVIRHAFLPAIISYVALLYIVHLEALKSGMHILERHDVAPVKWRLLMWGIVICSLLIVAGASYMVLEAIQDHFSDGAGFAIAGLLVCVYVALVAFASRYPDLERDDPSQAVVVPKLAETVKTGLHYLLPVVVLVWCLMVERLSPGLSAFWATAVMMGILVTQRALLLLFRGSQQVGLALMQGVMDLRDGLITGARNMIGIGVATAAAGIIVGTVSLTGIGQIMTEIVEVLSGGSLVLMLVFTALISLILGMGLPTTANYIVVSSIMVGVVQELGVQHGLIVPAIAIHLFVFYFGIMADITPPVGLASFAAAAISKGDPITTGLQAFIYSLRTAVLPFFFIFNTSLLLIDVNGPVNIAIQFAIAMVAILLLSAALQGYFIARSSKFESLLLLLVATVLFIPNVVMDAMAPAAVIEEGSAFEQIIENRAEGEVVKFYISGKNIMGDVKERYVEMPVGAGDSAAEKLKSVGLTVMRDGERLLIDNIGFNSVADKAGLAFDYEIVHVLKPQPQPDPRLLIIPSLLIVGMVALAQRYRVRRA